MSGFVTLFYSRNYSRLIKYILKTLPETPTAQTEIISLRQHWEPQNNKTTEMESFISFTNVTWLTAR